MRKRIGQIIKIWDKRVIFSRKTTASQSRWCSPCLPLICCKNDRRWRARKSTTWTNNGTGIRWKNPNIKIWTGEHSPEQYSASFHEFEKIFFFLWSSSKTSTLGFVSVLGWIANCVFFESCLILSCSKAKEASQPCTIVSTGVVGKTYNNDADLYGSCFSCFIFFLVRDLETSRPRWVIF